MTQAFHLPLVARRQVGGVWVVAVSLVLALSGSLPAAAQDEPRSVVATTEVLGSLVEQLVGDAAEVTVIMPSGANPHSYEASARDAEEMLGADVLVSNGLDLEEALVSVLEAAAADGVTWFQAADHVSLRLLADGEEQDDHGDASDGAAADAHDDGPEDPHVWTDPLLMRDVVLALATTLGEAGIDIDDRGTELADELAALDADVDEVLSVVPSEARKLVTGHHSLGYFADRYGFELIGTVIPGLSTSGEPSARALAQLIDEIKSYGVPAVFTEVGTPMSVAEAVADDSGAVLVPLSTSQLPEGGTYQDLMREIATTVAGALAD